jgi:hypothetical protein
MAERFPAVTFRSYLQPFLEHSAWLYLIRTTLCSQQLLEIQTGIVEDLRLDHPYAIHLKLCSWQKLWMWTWQRAIDRTISLIDPDGCSIPYVVFLSSIHRSTEIHLILGLDRSKVAARLHTIALRLQQLDHGTLAFTSSRVSVREEHPPEVDRMTPGERHWRVAN